jgi:hypothetical protein
MPTMGAIESTKTLGARKVVLKLKNIVVFYT